MSLLSVEDVTMRFGGLVANERVSFRVEEGQILSVIGPNGAGKTTLFNAITGIYRPTEGRVLFQGAEVVRRFSTAALLRALAVGAVTAVAAVVLLNSTPLWQAAISAPYVYGEAFPWGDAVRAAWRTLAELPAAWGAVPAAIAFLVGTAAALVLWRNGRRTPELIARAGIARTFQNIRLFGEMTLLENVLVGMHGRLSTGYWTSLLRLPSYWRERRHAAERAMELLHFVELDDRAFEPARGLPYGLQRRLEIARALASRPRLLLLDEPAAGMNPTETVELMELIRRIRAGGTTVLLIEHHMRVVMGISDRIVVLNFGRRIAEGTPEEIRRDPACIEAYLGKEGGAWLHAHRGPRRRHDRRHPDRVAPPGGPGGTRSRQACAMHEQPEATRDRRPRL